MVKIPKSLTGIEMVLSSKRMRLLEKSMIAHNICE